MKYVYKQAKYTNLFLSYIVFQLRKTKRNIFVTVQEVSSIDIRYRRQWDYYLEFLIECDISRLRELYKERKNSSDNYWILKSLNKIDKAIIKGREEFEMDDIISPILNLGYNINTFIKRYVNYITSNQ